MGTEGCSRAADDSEELREALITLERLRRREEEARKEAQALLSGLHILNNVQAVDEMFLGILQVIKAAVPFTEAAILLDENDSTLRIAASSSARFHFTVASGELFRRVLGGQSAAITDLSKTAEWRQIAGQLSESYGSAVLAPLQTPNNRALLFCVHRERAFLSRSHLLVLKTFSPLAAQALLRSQQLERRTAEDQLRRLNASLEERVRDEVQAREEAQARLALSEKLSALGQLAGGVAHDFNNIMQAVISGASLVQRRADDPAEVRRFAQMIDETARRGASVTRRLLTLARRDDLQAAPVNVAALLKGLCELLAHTLGTAIEIKLDVVEDLPSILADQSRLETALVNLATNARDAMRDGGAITISARAETVADGEPSAELAPGAYVRLVISDTGEGMEKATLRRALEPFFTTKEQGKGTGLGLSMACGFAEQSGGALTVISEPGRGTNVTLWLPVAEAAALPSEAREQTSFSAYSAGRRLLLVDDETMVREVLAGELVDRGYDVVQAESGFAALVLINSDKKLDLIVTDLSMPGMDGVSLIRAAQERRNGLPAILLTGCVGGDVTQAVAAAEGGLMTVLRKPISGIHLFDQIESLLESSVRSPASPTILT